MPPKTKSPGPIPKEALAYFKAKKLRPEFSYLDVWREEHTIAFTVAKVLERDLLADVQTSLERALEEGVPFKQWAKDIKPTLDQSRAGQPTSKSRMSRGGYTQYTIPTCVLPEPWGSGTASSGLRNSGPSSSMPWGRASATGPNM
jgi:uncharacterized protein with gpF-like domain